MPRRSYHSFNRSEWQTKGMTERAERAAGRYGLTMQQLQDAKIECQYRSYFGNCYAVVKISDVAALSRKLKAEEAEKEEKRLIEKHGEEGLKKLREAEKKAEEQKELIAQYKGELTFLQKVETKLKIQGEEMVSCDAEEPRMGKTAMKRAFKFGSSRMCSLEGKEVAVGRRKFYKASDMIEAARKDAGWRQKLDLSKLSDSDALQAYAYVLSQEIKETVAKMEPESIEEAQKEAKGEMAENVKKAEVEEEKAKAALEKAEEVLELAKESVENFEEFLEGLGGQKKKGKKRAASGKRGKKKKKKT